MGATVSGGGVFNVSPVSNNNINDPRKDSVSSSVTVNGSETTGGGVDLITGAKCAQSGPDEVAAEVVANGSGNVNVGEVIVVQRPRQSRRRRRRPSESELSSRTSHSTKSSFSTSSSSRYSGSGTPCHRGSSCSEAETSSTTSSETETAEPDLPYPGFPAVSLKYLSQTTTPRNWCLKLITNPYPFSKVYRVILLGSKVIEVQSRLFFRQRDFNSIILVYLPSSLPFGWE